MTIIACLYIYLNLRNLEVPVWAQLVGCLILDFGSGHDLGVVGAQHGVSLRFSLPLTLPLMLSLQHINECLKQ